MARQESQLEPLGEEEILSGRYQLLDVLARGGMAVVYRARQVSLDREVVVKALRPSLDGGETMARRFEREVDLVKRLHHPHIVQLYDFGRGEDGSFYLVMEYLQGQTLKALIGETGGLNAGDAGELMLQVLSALSTAHDQGIIHRDVKPNNIFVTSATRGPDVVNLLDFGVAKSMQPDQLELTDPGVVIGTTSYVAPELIRGEAAEAAADVYAAGLVFVEMLTGQKVITGQTTLEKLFRHLNTPVAIPAPLEQTALGEVIRRATSKELEGRFVHAGEMFDSLKAALSQIDTQLYVGLQAPEPAQLSESQREQLRTIEHMTKVGFSEDIAVDSVAIDAADDHLRTLPTIRRGVNTYSGNVTVSTPAAGAITETLQLGPFVLGERIGKGGMGAVYAAHHAKSGAQIAVKVLRGNLARQPDMRRDFRREVRAMARLNHPGIATIIDYGTVDEQTALVSHQQLTEGAPWLAMEHIDGEPLNRVVRDWGWSELSRFLRATLDALSHAHARDVVHRDLKPSNVLVSSDKGLIKLVDFGIARIFDDINHRELDYQSETITGTPRYMAPEQALGQWRSQGPWTDLYALACIAWFISCASPMFDGESHTETLRQHIEEPPPPFLPRFKVPDGFERWLHSLLVKDPVERVANAADALRELDVLDAPTARFARPTVPPKWKRHEHHRAAPLPKAGLRLFGLRTVPMVDRDQERSWLWEQLRQVDQQQSPRLVLIEGGPGTGKSRLARWLLNRARELGVGESLTAVHTATGSPADGLRGMVRRWARTAGLTRSEVYDRLAKWLPALPTERNRLADARALTEFLRPSTNDQSVEGPRYRLRHIAQEHALMGRFVARLAQRRPVIVWLDDLQWSGEAIGAVEYILNRAPLRPRVMVVATVRADLLVEQPELSRRLDRLCEGGDAQRIQLDALGVEHHRELIERLLHLDRRLVDLLAERTEGNPLFAIQLVQDWVERGYLTAADKGFRLAEGVELELPDDVHALWTERIERLIAEYPREDQHEVRQALELAAALGREVDAREWRALCVQAGVTLPENLDERLVERGLVRQADGGFTFVHGLLVDSLAMHAREAGRWIGWHRHCAQMLENKEQHTGRSTALRRGHHWRKAHVFDQAVEPLWEAARRASMSQSFVAAVQIYAHHEGVLDQLEAAPCDRRRIEGKLELARVYQVTGKIDAARALIDEAEACLDGLDEPRLRASAHLRRAGLSHVTGHTRGSIPDVEQALELFRQIDDPEQEACLRRLARSAWQLGDPERALSLNEQALEVARDYGTSTGPAHRAIGIALRLLGREEGARHHLELALEEFEEDENSYGVADVINTFGELAREAGRLAEAERHYRRAYQLYQEMGSADVATGAINLGLVQIERGEYASAGGYFEQAARHAHATGYRFIEYFALCGALLTCAQQAEWSRFDEHLETIRGLDSVEHGLRDLPDMLMRTSQMVVGQGKVERARRVLGLALQQWRMVGDDAERLAAEQWLETLELA